MKNKIRWDNLAIVLFLTSIGVGFIASFVVSEYNHQGIDPGCWLLACIAGFSPVAIMFILCVVGFIIPTVGHTVFGWHECDEVQSFDGCSMHSKCKYCGKEVMMDSQGNWF